MASHPIQTCLPVCRGCSNVDSFSASIACLWQSCRLYSSIRVACIWVLHVHHKALSTVLFLSNAPSGPAHRLPAGLSPGLPVAGLCDGKRKANTLPFDFGCPLANYSTGYACELWEVSKVQVISRALRYADASVFRR